MTVQNPPLWLQAGSHPAEDFRRLISGITAGIEGVVKADDLKVTEKSGTANLSVDVAGGMCVINGDLSTYQGAYFCENRGVTNLAIAAADATNARIDLVIAEVLDAAYSGSDNFWQLRVVTGTASGSPTVPSVPNNAVALAQVSVPALDTVITNSQITDLRTRAALSPGFIVCTSTTRPASPQRGMVIYETNTDRVLIYNGSAWIGLGATAALPPLFYASAGTNLTATTPGTQLMAQNSILTAPYPLTMVVTAQGDLGSNAAANSVYNRITDEAGTGILLHTGALNGGYMSTRFQSGDNGESVVMIGKKDYAAGATCGFRHQYYVSASNVYMSFGFMVQFFPKVS